MSPFRSYLLLILVYFTYFVGNTQSTDTSKLRSLIKQTQDQEEKLGIGAKLLDAYYHQGNLSEGLKFGRTLLLQCDTNLYSINLSKVYNRMGTILSSMGGFDDKALQFTAKGLQIAEEINWNQGLITGYNNLGNVYRDMGYYTQAHDYYIRTLEACEADGDSIGKSYAYKNLGILYEQQQWNEKALEYHKMALAIRKRLGNKREVLSGLLNVGTAYNLLADYQHGLQYLEEAEILALELNSELISEVFLEKGNTYLKLNNYSKSIETYQQGLELAIRFSKSRTVSHILNQLIGIHLRFRNIGKVQELLEQYRAHQDTIQYVTGNIHYFKRRYQTDSAQGNTSATLHNFRKWVGLKDSMDRLISSEDLLRKQSAFDLIQRDTQLKILQERQHYQRNLFISIIVFLGVCAVGLVRMIMQKNHHSKRMYRDQQLILEKNNELHHKNEELLSLLEELKKAEQIIHQQNQQIQKNNDELVKEVKARTNEIVERQDQLAEFAHIVSHDLRGPVARILGLHNILKFSQSEEELSKILEQLNKSILEIDMVCRDINKVFDATLGVRAKLELVETLPLVDRILNDLKVEIEQAGARVTYHIHENVNHFFSCSHYVRGNLDEMLLNALKFRNDDRPLEVHIEVQKIGSEYHFSITDNGIGIDLKRFGNDVFAPYKRFQTHRTGRGFGLFLLKHRTEILGGKVSIKSEAGLSTMVTFTIPEATSKKLLQRISNAGST